MALSAGSGPLGHHPAGHANYRIDGPAHRLYLEPSQRRLRAVVGDTVVADTVRPVLLHESGLLPVWYVPIGDLDPDFLVDSATTTHCPFKGDARYWGLRVGERQIDDAVWAYPEPLEGAPEVLADLAAIRFDAVDRWLEEDLEVAGHPRDPYHRVETLPSSRRVVVHADLRILADTTDAVAVFETSLAPRWYVPSDDVDTGALHRSQTTTSCPYKGVATYYSLGELEGGEDAVWAYTDPRPEAEGIRDLLCFDPEVVTVEVMDR